MPIRSKLAAALLGLPLLLAGHSAMATAYSFNSSGSFSNCAGCSISTSGAEIGWGGTNSINGTGFSSYNGSTIIANPLSAQTGTTPATQDTIASLTWFNSTSSADSTAMTVTADYKLALNFTSPSPGGLTNDVFDLNITNTANNARVCVFFIFCSNTGDVNDTTSFSNGSNALTVDGLSLTNISFVASGDSTFNSTTGIWSNPEGDSSTLLIKANIAALPVTQVPEPGSLAILGTALAGLAYARRRIASR